jgi:hypothetical protein
MGDKPPKKEKKNTTTVVFSAKTPAKKRRAVWTKGYSMRRFCTVNRLVTASIAPYSVRPGPPNHFFLPYLNISFQTKNSFITLAVFIVQAENGKSKK